MTSKGSCLCGGVSLEAADVNANFGACHCSMCRNWGGGPLLTVSAGQEIKLDGEEYLAVYSSSEWAERGFCKKCGTHLFYRLKNNKQDFVPLGLLEKSRSFHFDHQVFVDDQPGNYTFSEKTKNMTGAEVFEIFSSST